MVEEILVSHLPGTLSRSAVRRRSKLVLVAALATILAACGTSATPSTATPSDGASTTAPATAGAAPDVVSIALNTVVPHAAYFVGIETGIYLKHGIDLKAKVFETAADGIKALQAGETQAMANTWSAIAPAVSAGVPLRVFSLGWGNPDSAKYDGYLMLTAREGAGITDVAGLRGKTVAVSFGGGVDLWVRTQMRNAGIDPETDATMVNMRFANIPAALQTSQIDAGATSEPYGSLALATVPGSSLVVRGGGLVDLRGLLVGMDDWIAENPDIVDRLIAANLESLQYVREHPAESAEIASHFISGVDVDVLAESVQVVDYDPRWSDVIRQGLEESSAEYLESGSITTPIDVNEVLLTDLLVNAEETYPEFFDDLQ
jgi:ABC-type nitrate/sulfonate/bicarbonate transport system substrate-binding protein